MPQKGLQVSMCQYTARSVIPTGSDRAPRVLDILHAARHGHTSISDCCHFQINRTFTQVQFWVCHSVALKLVYLISGGLIRRWVMPPFCLNKPNFDLFTQWVCIYYIHTRTNIDINLYLLFRLYHSISLCGFP